MSQSTEGTSSVVPAKIEGDGYIIITLGYSEKWLVPHSDGLKLIESLKHARVFKKGYNDEYPTISTLPPVDFQFITDEQYLAWQVKEMLSV